MIWHVTTHFQALISASLGYKASRCHSLVLQLSQISSYCGLSYLSLLTTYEVETVASSIFGGSTLVHLVSIDYLKVSTKHDYIFLLTSSIFQKIKISLWVPYLMSNMVLLFQVCV